METNGFLLPSLSMVNDWIIESKKKQDKKTHSYGLVLLHPARSSIFVRTSIVHILTLQRNISLLQLLLINLPFS